MDRAYNDTCSLRTPLSIGPSPSYSPPPVQGPQIVQLCCSSLGTTHLPLTTSILLPKPVSSSVLFDYLLSISFKREFCLLVRGSAQVEIGSNWVLPSHSRWTLQRSLMSAVFASIMGHNSLLLPFRRWCFMLAACAYSDDLARQRVDPPSISSREHRRCTSQLLIAMQVQTSVRELDIRFLYLNTTRVAICRSMISHEIQFLGWGWALDGGKL